MYGNNEIAIDLHLFNSVKIIAPPSNSLYQAEHLEINFQPLYDIIKLKNKKPQDQIVGIAINDKTRPVPYSALLPPLLSVLTHNGIKKEHIKFYVANGTHVPDSNLNYLKPLENNLDGFEFLQHSCDDDLLYLGETSYKTPVFINRKFYQSDLKISVGNIEPHHFAVYSGGVKTPAIGLAGRETITKNHSLLKDEHSVICEYENNKLRMDIEKIGEFLDLDLALNCVQTNDHVIVRIFFDKPKTVMRKGIPIVDELFSTPMDKKYDLVIASAGGYPKDINFYQAQKASTNAVKILKPGGILLLVAECRDGHGSEAYFNYVKNFSSPQEVINDFENNEFAVGPHKAYLTSRIQSKANFYLYSKIEPAIVSSLLLEPVSDLTQCLTNLAVKYKDKDVAIMPNAVTTIPKYFNTL